MSNLLDLIIDAYETPDDAAIDLPEADRVREVLAANPNGDPWALFWGVMADCYETEEDLAMALGIYAEFTDTGFVS